MTLAYIVIFNRKLLSCAGAERGWEAYRNRELLDLALQWPLHCYTSQKHQAYEHHSCAFKHPTATDTSWAIYNQRPQESRAQHLCMWAVSMAPLMSYCRKCNDCQLPSRVMVAWRQVGLCWGWGDMKYLYVTFTAGIHSDISLLVTDTHGHMVPRAGTFFFFFCFWPIFW